MSELVGGDLMEHNILHPHIGVTEALASLARWDTHRAQFEVKY